MCDVAQLAPERGLAGGNSEGATRRVAARALI